MVSSKLNLFADDTTVHLASESIEYVAQDLTNDLNSICSWFDHNRLIVKLKNTNAMLFTRCTSSVISSNIDLHIWDYKLIFLNTFKLLAFWLIENFIFRIITCIFAKVNRKCSIISQNISLFSTKFKKILFKSFIISHFQYCSTLFISINQTPINKLEKCLFFKE